MEFETKVIITFMLVAGYFINFIIVKMNSAIQKNQLKHDPSKLEAFPSFLQMKNIKKSIFIIYPIIAVILMILIWAEILVIPRG